MKISRIISIIMLLLERKKISATKLAEMLEVTPRTIFRDIEAINMAGIPIVTYPGVNGGIGIMEEYKIERKLFTAADINALLIGLGSIHSSLSSEDIVHTMAKIKVLIPEEQVKQFENQITIDHTPWFGPVYRKPNLEEIRTALRENRFLVFQYSDQMGVSSERKIEPYRLVLKESNWYLQGYCTDREDFRTFRLSRVSRLQLLEDTFVPREFDARILDSVEQRFMLKLDSQGRLITLKLKIQDSLRDMMAGLCGEDCMEPYGEKEWLVHFPFIEGDFGYGMLFRFGDQCECLEPEHVRLELVRRMKRMMDLYEPQERDCRHP